MMVAWPKIVKMADVVTAEISQWVISLVLWVLVIHWLMQRQVKWPCVEEIRHVRMPLDILLPWWGFCGGQNGPKMAPNGLLWSHCRCDWLLQKETVMCSLSLPVCHDMNVWSKNQSSCWPPHVDRLSIVTYYQAAVVIDKIKKVATSVCGEDNTLQV